MKFILFCLMLTASINCILATENDSNILGENATGNAFWFGGWNVHADLTGTHPESFNTYLILTKDKNEISGTFSIGPWQSIYAANDKGGVLLGTWASFFGTGTIELSKIDKKHFNGRITWDGSNEVDTLSGARDTWTWW